MDRCHSEERNHRGLFVLMIIIFVFYSKLIDYLQSYEKGPALEVFLYEYFNVVDMD